MELLRRVVALLAAEGYRPVNCDITVVAERPKIGPHVEAMRERISAVLDVEPRRVSIKATTNERMGFVGREEGMAAYAVALIAER